MNQIPIGGSSYQNVILPSIQEQPSAKRPKINSAKEFILQTASTNTRSLAHFFTPLNTYTVSAIPSSQLQEKTLTKEQILHKRSREEEDEELNKHDTTHWWESKYPTKRHKWKEEELLNLVKAFAIEDLTANEAKNTYFKDYTDLTVDKILSRYNGLCPKQRESLIAQLKLNQ